MGKKKEQAPTGDDILQTLTDFTSKENWDKFFTLRGTDDAFEWYAEWPELKSSLLSELASLSTGNTAAQSLQILVPGCGSSKLSEHLYDAGFHGITNVDYSRVVITDMLRRNVRQRPDMRWRIMDMTNMEKFVDNTFDAIVDKGALDALMEPGQGHKLGSQYLTEAMRVLKQGGKFTCFTLAEIHVLGLLFSKFRVGWKMIIHAIPQKPSQKPSSDAFQTFMVIALKDAHGVVHQITSSCDMSSWHCSGKQVNDLFEELKAENRIRMEYSSGSDILHSLEDLRLGAKGDLDKLRPGLRAHVNLGDQNSQFNYRALLLDARQTSESFSYHCGVMLVPKSRARGWLYSAEEGQWTVVDNAKAARLIMVFLEDRHMQTPMGDIQRDLSRLIKLLEPDTDIYGSQIPFMMVEDAVKKRNLVHEVSSPMIGAITIDDVVYSNVDNGVSRILPDKNLTFRRLIFKRNEDLVQSEALLTKEGLAGENIGDSKSITSSKPKKKKGHSTHASGQKLRVSHDYLASPYHCGIISGFMLISSYMESLESAGKTVRAAVIGLGAGLLPMFLHGCFPFMQVEVVELDPIVVELARNYFSLSEDSRLKVHITDGVKFVKEAASDSVDGNENVEKKIDILMIDVDNEDTSSGLTCPAASFVEEDFLNDAKKCMSEQGLFVLNLVTRSPAVKERVISRVRKVFNYCVYSLKVEGDVNEVLFGLKSGGGGGGDVAKEDGFPEAAARLEKLLSCKDPKMSEAIIDATKEINKSYCKEEEKRDV